MKKLILTIMLTIFTFVSFRTNAKPTTFREAKKEMVEIFHALNNPTTLYCGCPILFTKNHGYRPDLKKCDYKVVEDEERGRRIEAEHIVPVWEFAHKMNCWTQTRKGNGRNNCEKTDDYFNEIEADLHNLYPSIGEVNKDRGSHAFVDKLRDRDNPKGYGKCQMYYNQKHYLSEPTKRSKGIIARAYLYMHQRYHLKLDSAHLRLYRQWNTMYKVTDNECKRNVMIKRIQGNDNPFVTTQCELRIKHPTVLEKTSE